MSNVRKCLLLFVVFVLGIICTAATAEAQWRPLRGLFQGRIAQRTVQRTTGYGQAAVQAPRGEWTYPGEITQHLLGPNHGFSAAELAGRSRAELERLHSMHHEGQVRPGGLAVAHSSCPTCPGGQQAVLYAGPAPYAPPPVVASRSRTVTRERCPTCPGGYRVRVLLQ